MKIFESLKTGILKSQLKLSRFKTHLIHENLILLGLRTHRLKKKKLGQSYWSKEEKKIYQT